MSFWQTLTQEARSFSSLVSDNVIWAYYRINVLDYDKFIASNQWSNRFVSQMSSNAKSLLHSSQSNPIHRVTEMIVGAAIEKHGFQKIKEITGKIIGKALVYGASALTVGAFIGFVSRSIIFDLRNSGFLAALVGRFGDMVLITATSTAIGSFLKFEQLQVQSAAALIALKKQDALLARKIFNANLDAFIFLAYKKYYEKILKGGLH